MNLPIPENCRSGPFKNTFKYPLEASTSPKHVALGRKDGNARSCEFASHKPNILRGIPHCEEMTPAMVHPVPGVCLIWANWKPLASNGRKVASRFAPKISLL